MYICESKSGWGKACPTGSGLCLPLCVNSTTANSHIQNTRLFSQSFFICSFLPQSLGVRAWFDWCGGRVLSRDQLAQEMSGRGGGRGGDGKPFGGPVSEHTVAEDMRIRFTRMLLKLREDTVKEVVFPSDLNNIERKFLHKLAEELGLKSKSHGKGDDRKITVTKPSEGGGGNESNGAEFARFTLNPRTLDVLQKNISSIAVVNPLADDANAVYNRSSEYAKASSIYDDAQIIRSAYVKAQAERQKKPIYPTMKSKRESLPAFFHQDAVTSLIKQEQIVLVSGETGCGKISSFPLQIHPTFC